MRSESRILANTLVRADIEAHEDLTIEGHVIGSVTGTAHLTIVEGAVVEADIHVRRIVVSGVVVGNISAVEAVEVAATGQVKGNIRTQALTLTTGGRISGNVKSGVSVEAAKPKTAGQRRRNLSNATLEDAPRATLPRAPAPPSASSNARGVTMQGVSPVSGLTQAQVLEQAAKQARSAQATGTSLLSDGPEAPESKDAKPADSKPLQGGEAVEGVDSAESEVVEDANESDGESVEISDSRDDEQGNRHGRRNRGHGKNSKKPQNA